MKRASRKTIEARETLWRDFMATSPETRQKISDSLTGMLFGWLQTENSPAADFFFKAVAEKTGEVQEDKASPGGGQ